MISAVLTPPGRTEASAPGAVVALRYRPLGDVLVAEVGAPDDAGRVVRVITETVDADLTLTSYVRADGSHRLASVEVVHASLRRVERLPHGLGIVIGRAVTDLIERGQRALDTTDSLAARARIVMRADVELDHPLPPVTSAPPPRPPVVGRTILRRAVLRVAGAVRSANALACSADAGSAASLVSALEELADALARRGGHAAPSSARVARARVVGAVGLSTAERVELRSLLDALDDTAAWPSLASRWTHLADGIAPWQARRQPSPAE